MKFIKIILLSLFSVGVSAQEDRGIIFEQGLSWQQVKDKAKKENKFIFMDCVTTWCVPCKEMARQVFPDPNVGEFMNSHFINIKVQMDRKADDPQNVKDWYADAEELAKIYDVVAYPTLLYFSPEGELVHRIVGGKDVAGFLAGSADALDSERQYHTQIKRFEAAPEKFAKDYLRLSIAAREVFDGKRANEYAKSYLALEPNLFTPDGIALLNSITHNSKDTYFPLLKNDGDKIDSIMGTGYTARKLIPIILQEEVYPNIPAEGPLDWDSLTAQVSKLYPRYGNSVIAKFKIQYFMRFEDWENMDKAVELYRSDYPDHLSVEDWNRLALTYYQLSKDRQAIDMQRRATELASGAMKEGFQELLRRMELGDRSWLSKE